jgi:hypothetical protein
MDYGETMNDDRREAEQELQELHARRIRRQRQLALAGTVLVVAAGIGAYFVFCPESPRFNRKPWKKEWWQRQRFHIYH